MPLARPLAWTALVLLLGSTCCGADQTAPALRPFLETLAPLLGTSPRTLHAAVRKAAHVTEYGILAWLWGRALAERRTLGQARWAALAICLACAVADEAHQTLVRNRTASARDVALDASGALAALVVVRRRRGAHALATWGAQSAPQSPHERLGAPRRSRGSPRDTPRGS